MEEKPDTNERKKATPGTITLSSLAVLNIKTKGEMHIMLICEGCTVKIKFNSTKKIRRLTAEDSSDSYSNRYKTIHTNFPVGQALLGKRIGDVFHVQTPGGQARIEVLEVTR